MFRLNSPILNGLPVEFLMHGSQPIAVLEEEHGAELPGYALMLAAYHRAYADTLCNILNELPIAIGASVLDLACGDGVYSCWLARRVTNAGIVVSTDISNDWLQVATDTALTSDGLKSPIVRCQSDAACLPFDDNRFDLVWCAQSLYSLPDAAVALAEMTRVVKPGGIVALLENDSLHHILLPWPAELEIEVRRAELEAFKNESDDPEKFYVGRRLRPLLEQSGLIELVERPHATSRATPVTGTLRTFLTEYMANLRRRVAPYLTDEVLAELDTLLSPLQPTFLLDSSGLTVTCVDQLIWGVKPA